MKYLTHHAAKAQQVSCRFLPSKKSYAISAYSHPVFKLDILQIKIHF
jgi:hypothetical protein